VAFTSLTFCLFLTIVFAAYWSIRVRSLQNGLLVLASYCFYGWWDARFCLLMLGSSLVDFVVGLGLNRAESRPIRRGLLSVSVVTNLGLLGFFKYCNFFTESLQAALASLNWQIDPLTLKVILPVGISFYTFQTMSYTFDVYAGRLKATGRIVDYLAYVSFFPQLVAGPIERATRLLPQFLAVRVFRYEQAVDGCRLILWGFFKKLVIADRISPFVDATYGSLDTAGGPQITLATVAFAFQIYCDFSAYSDIAIGTAKLFGFDLMRNFSYPYFSQSPGEFWRRWHISLSTWFRDYVYIPLGGSRVTATRIARNLLVTFTISGLWHGASWNFIIWGAIMGLGVMPEALRRPQNDGGERRHSSNSPAGDRLFPTWGTIGRMACTFALVCFGWIFFRAETLSDALLALEKMTYGMTVSAWSQLPDIVGEKIGRQAVLSILAVVTIEWLSRHQPHPLVFNGWRTWQRWAVYTALFWITLFVGPRFETQFIYFQF